MTSLIRLAVLTVGVAVLAIAIGAGGGGAAGDPAPAKSAAGGPVVDQVAPLPPGRRLLVRAVDDGRPRNDGALYELTPSGVARPVGDMRCKRVAASAAGPGICLALTKSVIGYMGIVFDADYERLRYFPVQGVPDRARISPDGRYGAFTTFDRIGSEEYFASTVGFSTQLDVVDLRTGRRALQEQDLVVTRDGRRFAPKDVEYWGITFIDNDRFYATMATGDDHYLIEGSVKAKSVRVVDDHVECPALSPDGTRIAYKRRIGNSNRWRLHVRDLDGGNDVALAERRSIDDQPEWLDDATVVYSDDKDVFTVPADGGGEPKRIADHATSPTAID